MSTDSPTIALVVPSAALISGPPVDEKLLHLVRNGWDAHLLFEAANGARSRSTESFLEAIRRGWDAPQAEREQTGSRLQDPRLRGRVHNAVDGRFERTLAAVRPQLVHFHSGPCAHARIGLAQALGSRVVVTLDGHDLATAGIEEPGYYRSVWTGADALHLPAGSLWPDALRRGCPPSQAYAVIPHAVDTELFQPRGSRDEESDGRLRILSVGALNWAQGYEYALQAVRLLLNRGVQCEYRIVGEGEYADALEFARLELRLDGAAEIHGATDLEGLRAHMKWAQVYLRPALIGGSSATLVQAQAMALPIVAAEGSGLSPGRVGGEPSGFFVPRRDPGALADKLALLAGDPPLRRRMGAAARALVLDRFTVEDHLARFDELYRRTLAS